eukprot:4690051-Prymnesium_polylepis.1
MATMAQSVREGAKCARAPARAGKGENICRADTNTCGAPAPLSESLFNRVSESLRAVSDRFRRTLPLECAGRACVRAGRACVQGRR